MVTMRLQAYAHNQAFPDARTMILDALGIDGNKIPRERAVYVGEDGPIIHTRTGGGNRDEYDTKEKYVSGEYGIDHNIKETQKALTDYSDFQWQITAYNDADYENPWEIPYEAKYRFPETDEEWAAKEAEIKQLIKDLEAQRVEVLATGAFTNEYLRNQYYIRDEDDDFDCTYADFFYKWPAGLKEKLKEVGYLED